MSAPPPAPADDPVTGRQRLFDVREGAHDALGDLARAAGASIESLHDRLDALHDENWQARKEERLKRRQRKRWVAYAFLLVAIVSGVTGTSALAQSAGFTRLAPMLLMGVAYLVCFLAMTRALQVIPVGIAYAIWSGVGIALITLIGFVALGQSLSPGELVGVGMILVGVVVIQLFSRAQAH